MRLVVGLTALVILLVSPARADIITYNFTSFDAPGDHAGGTVANGINNNGAIVGFGMNNGATVNTNYVRNPNGSFTTLNGLGSLTAMANGINDNNQVVGVTGTNAFILTNNFNTLTNLPPANPGNTTSEVAFGINNAGTITGQYVHSQTGLTPGFVDVQNTFLPVNPAGSMVTNVQGVNNNGLALGFFAITNTPVINNNPPQHGFLFDTKTSQLSLLPDPARPQLFLTQYLGINDKNQAAGYWQDTAGSQHGFIYNIITNNFSFLDDPLQAPFNGITVTQITGINDSAAITGFYMDGNGIDHAFVATPAVPEPGPLVLAGFGIAIFLGHARFRNRRKAALA
jgi:hypothetical protein